MRLSKLGLVFSLPFAFVACQKNEGQPPAQAEPQQQAQPQKPATPADPSGEKEHRGGQHENDEEREQQAVQGGLAITVNGKPAEAWSVEKLQRVKMRASSDGREMWSLRDLARELVGPKARVAAVLSGGSRHAIDVADWDDAEKTPAFRVNRQGQFKLEWMGVKSAKAGFRGEVREIDTIEIVE